MLYDIVIIGAGISGLTTAVSLFEKGVQHVLIVDYQEDYGGFAAPFFHAASFARERQVLEQASSLPYEVWYKATVIGFFAGDEGQAHQLYIQTTAGTRTVEAKRVVIASGALEKPREANKIAGTRPAGVMTPSMAAQLLLRGYLPGAHIALIQSGRLAAGVAALLADQECKLHAFTAEDWEVVEVKGRARLQEVVLQQRLNKARHHQACDTLIFSKGRIPCSFFLKGTSVRQDEHHAVVIDDRGRTNLEGVYATGSCTILGDDQHMTSIELARQMVPELLNHL